MKFITSFLLIVCYLPTFSQSKSKLIAQTRKEFKLINNDNTLHKVILDNEQFLDHAADGGAQLTGFYKAGRLKKIVRWIGLSYGNEIFEFYFKNDQLIFVYEEFHSFVYDEKTQSLRLDTTELTFAGRYYFASNKLIDYVTTGHNRFEDDNLDPGKILLAEAIDNRKLLARKKSNSR